MIFVHSTTGTWSTHASVVALWFVAIPGHLEISLDIEATSFFWRDGKCLEANPRCTTVGPVIRFMFTRSLTNHVFGFNLRTKNHRKVCWSVFVARRPIINLSPNLEGMHDGDGSGGVGWIGDSREICRPIFCVITKNPNQIKSTAVLHYAAERLPSQGPLITTRTELHKKRAQPRQVQTLSNLGDHNWNMVSLNKSVYNFNNNSTIEAPVGANSRPEG